MESVNPLATGCCILCGHFLRASENGEYGRCAKCGTVRTRYNYDPSMYSTSYADTYLKYASGPTNTPLNLFRVGLVSRWLRNGGKILDIGCCIGEFLRFAERHYTCIGFEPNKKAASHARSRCHSLILTSLNGSTEKVNCITLFDVLEHIETPVEFLKQLLSEYLLPSGVMVITTPNVEVIPAWDDVRLRKWKHWKPREHLWLYCEKGLNLLAEKVGLNCVHVGFEESEIRPGNPDGDIITFVARKEG